MRARVLAVAAAALLWPSVASAANEFRSGALDSDLHYLIQLPSGYATSRARYPVVYFLHGLPAGPDAYKSVAWVGEVLAKERKPAILVVPQGTRRKNGDPEYHDWGPATTGRPRSRSSCPAGSTATTGQSRAAAAGRSSACRRAGTAPPASG
jgi:predicted alpha/beta superfamily hydrolase